MLSGCRLIFVISAVLAQAQTQTEMQGPAIGGVDEVSIAAELKTTVKAENAHRAIRLSSGPSRLSW
jgi:hypothetical protein